MMHRQHKYTFAALAVVSCFAAANAQAEENSDTWISYQYGTHFGEPHEGNNITKSIVSLTHTGNYKYGTNFVNVDMYISDKHDPVSKDSSSGATETYVNYRNTVDLSKVWGKPDAFNYGPMRDLGVTVGFDWNNRDDEGYNSRKRMVVAGPTFMIKVPGYLNVSLLEAWESNAPYNKDTGVQTSRYNYDPHTILSLAWGIPFKIASVDLTYQGMFNYEGSKGKDEFGDPTKPEIFTDMSVMYDVGQWMGLGTKTLSVGPGYIYRRNKAGNDHNGTAGNGANTSTAVLRAEYHF